MLYDTAGQEYYGTVSRNFYRNATAVIFMFAYDDLLSLEGLTSHVEETNRHAHEKCLRILVCNKVDLEDEVISKDIIDCRRQLLECDYVFYVSALTGEGINKLLDVLFERMASFSHSDFTESIKLNYQKTSDRNQRREFKCCF